MYLLGVLCLLSAAVALPTPEQLHTNLPALPPPPELKSEEKDKSSDEKALNLSEPEIEEPEKSAESKIPSESDEKPKVEEDEDKEKPEDVVPVIQKDSKESKEAKDSKEKSRESKDSKESKEPWELKPEEPKEEKKEKDSKSEESKEKYEEEVPVIVEIIKKPKGLVPDWISNILSSLSNKFSFKLPFDPWPFRVGLRKGELQDQPIYIVRETDFDLY